MEFPQTSVAEVDPYQVETTEPCQATESESSKLPTENQSFANAQAEKSDLEDANVFEKELQRWLGTASDVDDAINVESSFERNVRPRLAGSDSTLPSGPSSEEAKSDVLSSDSFYDLQQRLEAANNAISKKGLSIRQKHPIDHRALLPERYEVDVKECYDMDVALLGKGGYGKVVVARDKNFGGRVVAIKQVVKKSKRHADAFHAEARVMRELDHPSICRLFEVFEDERNMFFVMELCAGGHLFGRIVKEGKITESVAAHILSQVAGALRYAHDRQIAHRDLKPDNICFLSSDPNDKHIKVIDWGLSAVFIEKRMRSVCGTFSYTPLGPGPVSYAAPEVLSLWGIKRDDRDPYGCSCDLWSLGVIVYVMLSGRPPFAGDRGKMLENMRLARYAMGDDWSSISDSGKDFVRSLLQPDPGKRPSSADVVLHPWLLASSQSLGSEPSAEVCAEVLSSMKKFSHLSHFRSLCTTIIAQQLDSSHLHDMQRLFQSLDTSGDGVLSVEEVKTGFSNILGASCVENSKIDEVFKAMDLDGSGAIDYTEFIAAGLCSRMSTQDEALWAAFRSLDRSSTNGITSEDITNILSRADVQNTFSGNNCDALAKEVLKRCDQNSNGTIDFEEFREFMTAATPGPDQSPRSIGLGSPCSDTFPPIPTPDCLKSPIVDLSSASQG